LVLFLALAAGPAASDAVDFRRYVVIGGAPTTIGPFGLEPSMKGVFEIYSLQPDGSSYSGATTNPLAFATQAPTAWMGIRSCLLEDKAAQRARCTTAGTP
jgi:hypothetical protein